jgi:UDP-glucose 4-epimerase
MRQQNHGARSKGIPQNEIARFPPFGLPNLAIQNLLPRRKPIRVQPLRGCSQTTTATLNQVMRRHKPDAVINFAALAYVGESNKEPTLYYRNNVAGMVTLLETMRDNDVGSIVFSSSCATYGVPHRVTYRTTRKAKTCWRPS